MTELLLERWTFEKKKKHQKFEIRETEKDAKQYGCFFL